MTTCISLLPVFLLVLCLPSAFSQDTTEICDEVLVTTTIKETTEPGYLLYNLSDVSYGDSNGWDGYAKEENGSIIIANVPDLDGVNGTKASTKNTMRLICANAPYNTVEVYIEYVNEYVPTFPLAEFTVNISECLPFCGTGSSIAYDLKTHGAIDLDRVPVGGNDAEESITYTLDAGDAPFQYDERQNAITIAGKLDFDEGPRLYKLMLYATDTGGGETNGTIFTGNTTLLITIEDSDDLDPIFDPQEYNLTIQEENSTLIGLPMTTTPPIYAYDQDLGLNDTVSYSISGGMSTLNINQNSGELTINRVLDRETTPSPFNIIIKACQVNNAIRCAESVVKITVADVNDNRPEFNTTTMAVSMMEELPVGTRITQVSARDDDEGTNAEFTYTLHSYQDAIDINKNDGTLTIKNSTYFDREDNPRGLIVLIGTEETSGEVGGNLSLTITLQDANDNSPTFNSVTPSIGLSTGIKGTFVTQVDATDPDLGSNGDVWYSIPDMGHGDYFSINANIGSISVAKQLEESETYSCVVEACDNPQKETGRLCSMTAILVKVLSSNDSLSLEVNVSVSENVPRGTTVTVLLVDDIFHFVVVAEADHFSLNPVSGELTTNSAIDREEQGRYIVIINRTLGLEPKGIFTVNVDVLDLNDNIPTFFEPEYTFNVPVTAGVGYIVGSVSSYDNDTDPENNMVTYSMQSTSESGFKIDNTTGKLELVSNMTQNEVKIFITASDHGTPSLQSTVVATFIYGGDDSYVFDVNAKADGIKEDKEDIRGKLDTVLGVSSNIVIITNDEVADISSCRTEIRLSAMKDGHGLSKSEIESVILDNNEEFKDIFRSYEESCAPTVPPGNDSLLGTVQIVLIVVGSLFLVLAVALLIIMYSQRQKFKRYKRLNRALSIGPPNIYEVQEVKIDIEDNASLASNPIANMDAVLTDNTQALANGILTVGTLNPAYESDSETDIKQVANLKNDSSSTETNDTFVHPDDDEGYANGNINLLDAVLTTYEDSHTDFESVSMLAPMSVDTNIPVDIAADYNDASESSPHAEILTEENPVYNVDVEEPTPDYGKSVRFQPETIVISTEDVETNAETKDDVADYVNIDNVPGTPLPIGSKSAARQQTNEEITNPPPPPPTDTYDAADVSAETSATEEDTYRQQIPDEDSGDSLPSPPPPPPLPVMPLTPSGGSKRDKTDDAPSTPKVQPRQSSDLEKSLHAELLQKIKKVVAKNNNSVPNTESVHDPDDNVGSTDM